MRAQEVAEVITEVLARCPHVEVVQHPVADGGEGTVAVALAAGFEPVAANVTGPLGRPVEATFAMRERMAVIEMASAAGLALRAGPRSRYGVELHDVRRRRAHPRSRASWGHLRRRGGRRKRND